jgi:hypothetical protein
VQGGGCDPYFDVRLGDGKKMIFDWKAAHKGKVKNYKPKHKIVDFDLWPHNIRVKVCPARQPQERCCTFCFGFRESHTRFANLARSVAGGCQDRVL